MQIKSGEYVSFLSFSFVILSKHIIAEGNKQSEQQQQQGFKVVVYLPINKFVHFSQTKI
jgi:hypothetical protein